MLTRENIPIHFVDFEGSAHSGIVEFGVVTLLGDRIVKTHTRLCAPVGEIDAQSFAQHGIRARDAEAFAPFSEEWELFNELRGTGPLAAHHASVEDGFLRAVWHCPRAAPDFMSGQALVADWGPWLDTRQLAERTWSRCPQYKLGVLVEYLQLQSRLETLANQYCSETRRKAHCALYDALASALVWQCLVREPMWNGQPLARLFQESVGRREQRDSYAQGDWFA